MSEYLRTSGITAAVDDLIIKAKKELYIVSPYLKLLDNVKRFLEIKNNEKIPVTVVYGKDELAASEKKFLAGLKHVRLLFCKNLHAKCYLNEDKMVICSMNLYEFSQLNNYEMGILVSKDEQIYKDAMLDIKNMLISDSVDVKNESKSKGYCIRTGVEIPFNVDRPLCYNAYKEWSKHNNPDYPEKYCHFSGEKSNGETSVSKPILKKNWSKAKETFDL